MRKKAGNSKQEGKKKWCRHLKFYLRLTLLILIYKHWQLKTDDGSAGFLGIWELLYIETWVASFFQITASSCLMSQEGKKKKKSWLKRQWKFKISDVLTMNLVVPKHCKSEFDSLYQLRAWRTTGKNTRYECQSKGTTQPETPGTFPGGKALLASFQHLVHTRCVKDNSNCNPRNAQLNSIYRWSASALPWVLQDLVTWVQSVEQRC